MIRLFERWLVEDNPKIQIPRLQDFIRGVMGIRTVGCEFNNWCQHYLMFDYDGIVRVCCSLPQDWVLGNILTQSLRELYSSRKLIEINQKIAIVRKKCEGCRWQEACQGGCPGYSLLRTQSHNVGERSYFCQAYKNIYTYLENKLRKISI